MSVGSPFPRALAFSIAIVFALSCAATAVAQSGRRARTPSTPTPVPAPSPEPTPSSAITLQQPKPILRLVVGVEAYDSFLNITMRTYNAVLPACARRLEETQSVSVEQLERPISRSEATNLAKADKNAYVVWLRVREDDMGSRPTGSLNNVYIEYFVFAPTTAKVVSSGSAYLPNRSTSQSSRIPSVNADREVIEAARTAANKIIAGLRMHLPSRPAPALWLKENAR